MTEQSFVQKMSELKQLISCAPCLSKPTFAQPAGFKPKNNQDDVNWAKNLFDAIDT